MNDLGFKIKKMRQNRNIKAKDVYDGILSKAMYYRFEKQEGQISYHSLFEICQRLNIELSDLSHFQSYKTYHDLFHQIYTLFYQKKMVELSQYAQWLEEEYKRTKYMKFQHAGIIANALVCYLQGGPFAQEQIEIIKTYLFNVDYWYQYEVELILNSLFIFSLTEIDYFYLRLVKTLKKTQQGTIFILLTAGIIYLCMLRDDKGHFVYYLKQFNRYCPSFAYTTVESRINKKFYLLLYRYEQAQDNEDDIKQLLASLQIMDLHMIYRTQKMIFLFLKSFKGRKESNEGDYESGT